MIFKSAQTTTNNESGLLANTRDNRRNCRLIHLLDRMRKITAILGTALICVAGSVATTFAQTPVPPKNGYVPDAATAIKIAVAVWTPIYGERQIADEKPYRATLKDGVWTVEGSMPPNLIEIAKSDGRILRVEHGE